MKSGYSPHIQIMIQAARKASRALVRDFGEVERLQVSKKGLADFVTNADQRSERIIKEELQSLRPNYGFLLEESGEIQGTDPDGHRFIVDPLDGTTNFIHGIPFVAIAIALEKINLQGKPEIIAAVVEAPILQETYYAEKGSGAWLERGHLHGNPKRERLRVAQRRNIDEAVLLAACSQYGGSKQHQAIERLKGKLGGIRAMGSSALELAYIAAGRGDIYFQHQEKPWDLATGILLVREAGGIVTDMTLGSAMLEEGSILASNDILHEKISQLVITD